MTNAESSVESTVTPEIRSYVRRFHRRTALYVLIVFAVAISLLPLFFYTFWVLLETIARMGHIPRIAGLLGRLFPDGFASIGGWPFDGGFVLSTLACWSVLYLGYDTAALRGGAELASAARSTIETILKGPLPADSFLVEIRPELRLRRGRWRPDTGWIIFTDAGFHFIGAYTRAWGSAGSMQVEGEAGKIHGSLSATWISVRVRGEAATVLRVLVYSGAGRISETSVGARRLAAVIGKYT